MKRSLLTYFAWISLVLLLAVSCRSARVSYSGLPVEIGSSEKMTVKTQVTWGERELSGLMMMKKTEDGNVKIAFYNELGLTYLEGTLDRSSKHQKLIIKNIAPAINFKPFIKNFEKCLREICKPKIILVQTGQIWDTNDKNITIELKNGFKMNVTTL
jgi:hypothetical protein